jgi:hypothetical protein
VSPPDESTGGDIKSLEDLSVGGVGGLVERLSTIEKAGSPTASAIIRNRGIAFLGHIVAALRYEPKVDIRQVPERCEITQAYYNILLCER